jgi:hypothetical protein
LTIGLGELRSSTALGCYLGIGWTLQLPILLEDWILNVEITIHEIVSVSVWEEMSYFEIEGFYFYVWYWLPFRRSMEKISSE